MSSVAGLGLLQAPPEPSLFSMLLPMAAIFGIFYFLLIRPQQRRQREQEAMLKAIEKGDEVITYEKEDEVTTNQNNNLEDKETK